jgi:Uma2 family endonuclease
LLSSFGRDTLLKSMHSWSPALGDSPGRGSRKLTLEQWLSLAEDVSGELVDGFLMREEVADPIHGLAVSWLIALLRGWLAGKGFVFDSDVKLVILPTRGRKADVSVYFPGRPPPPRRGGLSDPPDIAVEVVSASPRDERRDRVEKMTEYAEFGIRYYWLLDPALRSFEVFELNSSRQYVRALARTEGQLTDIPGCPGLTLNLASLWSELERLSPEAGG